MHKTSINDLPSNRVRHRMYQDTVLCGGISSLESFSFIKEEAKDSLYLFMSLLINTLKSFFPKQGQDMNCFQTNTWHKQYQRNTRFSFNQFQIANVWLDTSSRYTCIMYTVGEITLRRMTRVSTSAKVHDHFDIKRKRTTGSTNKYYFYKGSEYWTCAELWIFLFFVSKRYFSSLILWR